MPILKRVGLLGGAVETTSGTEVFSSVTAALNGSFYDIEMDAVDWMSDGQRAPDGLYGGTGASVAGARKGTLKFTVDLAPGVGFMQSTTSSPLTACGFYNTSSGVFNYTTNMANRKTWTFKKWEGQQGNARIKRMYGCAGTFGISFKAGEKATANFDLQGAFTTLDTDGSPPATSPPSTLPFVCQAMTFTIGGSTIPYTGEAEFSLNADVGMIGSFTSTDGIGYFYVADVRPQWRLKHEAQLKATLDNYGILGTGTEAALSIVLTRGASTLTIACPKLQRQSISTADSDGRLMDDTVWACNVSSGDDFITFTAA